MRKHHAATKGSSLRGAERRGNPDLAEAPDGTAAGLLRCARNDGPAPANAPLGDLRFRALMGAEQWASLAPAIRRRFSKRLAGSRTAVYAGTIGETRMTRLGWLLAQAARLVGGPLPLSRDPGVPATVTVTEDAATGGQVWTRIYGRRRGFPQVIHSAKRFRGPTGLEEYLGHGFGMALTVDGAGDALTFRSDHYFVQLSGRRVRLPRWLGPGVTTVSHVDHGDGRFTFTLELRHPRFGVLIRQTGMFRDVADRDDHTEAEASAAPVSRPLPNPSRQGTALRPRGHASKGEGLDRRAFSDAAPLPRAAACQELRISHGGRGRGGGDVRLSDVCKGSENDG